MSFSTKKYDNYTLIVFSTDKLDAVVSPDLKAELVLINKGGEKNILIDLTSVKYCDSSGLSALLIGNRLCKEASGSFILSCLQASVQKLIVISQLDSVLTITPTLPEAIDLLFMEEIERDLDLGDLDD
ncbi:STAS domain-containing protein [Vicingus serpentipes]|uniref:Anti-sigma factor antagonist n=1 Tax=Vicingus serpentipes TaxID=1926625 RepID=A0A5C6RV91_9FLAO|nr:STAS domain-containing protein [Vicingus serpentipes]TXB65809.1 STAS domain-containing protein [Vicingus serpentipes]